MPFAINFPNPPRSILTPSSRLSFSETRERLSFRRLSISSPKSDAADSADSCATPERRAYGSVGSIDEHALSIDVAGLEENKAFDLNAEELRVLESGGHVCR